MINSYSTELRDCRSQLTQGPQSNNEQKVGVFDAREPLQGFLMPSNHSGKLQEEPDILEFLK